MNGTIELKPIDEDWMLRALVFVVRYRQENNCGPTWTELWDHMGWRRRSCTPHHRMGKLTKRGLVWSEEHRSLDLSPEGIDQLSLALSGTTVPTKRAA